MWFGLLSFLDKIFLCLFVVIRISVEIAICLSSLDHHSDSLLIKWYPGQAKRESYNQHHQGGSSVSSEKYHSLKWRSLINITKKRVPRIYPWGTPSLTVVTEGYGPFKMTLCFLASSKSIIKLNKSPAAPPCFNL